MRGRSEMAVLCAALLWTGCGSGGSRDASSEDVPVDPVRDLVDPSTDPVAEEDVPEDPGHDAVEDGDASDPDPCEDHCTNGTEDCGEEGVDCGGECDPCEPAVFRTTDHAHEVCGPTPDADCTPADLAWVASEHGSTFTRTTDTSATLYRLLAFVEREGPSNIDVLVVGPDASPLSGIPVAFYYSTAPETSRSDEWYPVKATGITGTDGIAGFAIGTGAYYGCGEGGPHAIWVSEPGPTGLTTVPSDLADHLGMIVGTNHRHLELIFQRVEPSGSIEDGVRCPLR